MFLRCVPPADVELGIECAASVCGQRKRMRPRSNAAASDFSKEDHAQRVAEDKTREAAEDKNGARGLGPGRVARGIAVRRRRARHGRGI